MCAPYPNTGYRMIHSIDVRNFRCYSALSLDVSARLNVIVGDNGVGKTALLEAIFFALANASEIALRYRQSRGFDGVFSGTARRIEDALWGDFFTDRDMSKPIAIILAGDGAEKRSLTISRGSAEAKLFIEPSGGSEMSNGSINLIWTDSNGQQHVTNPTASNKGIDLPATNEDLPDFFNISAGMAISSGETAGRFSDLSMSGRKDEFVSELCHEFAMIKDLNIEVIGGAPLIFATLDGERRVPLPSVSFGINKIVGILACIASRPRSVITIDEMEMGLHFSHLQGIWSSILRFMRKYDSQLFISTHSKECIEALILASGTDADDIAIWRVEREDGVPVVRQFSGADAKLAIEYDEEVR